MVQFIMPTIAHHLLQFRSESLVCVPNITIILRMKPNLIIQHLNIILALFKLAEFLESLYEAVIFRYAF